MWYTTCQPRSTQCIYCFSFGTDGNWTNLFIVTNNNCVFCKI
ncbi:unknown [Sutterella wadsworthensis CAG:135]|nr:unknown [Sutterella wadsworthensis CAG:135]